ncbi:hypothetical protein BD309DRAFT_970438 [Dichomitus squalens]|nr:hypothetical protein BD309DRAFT_970438 [Dichomitus squalens]
MAAALGALESMFHELTASRYMTAVGLMVLLYDHALTFGDEVQYIWSAPATYAKYIFLLNRYTVLGTLLAVAYEMCGFVDSSFTDTGCKQFIFTCSMIAVVSVGIANLLTLQRVVILWDHRPVILKIMTVGFVISFGAQVATMIVTLINMLPFITWNTSLGMCVATKSSHLLIGVWACPMVFELFVLGSTALNALDRPRTVELPIAKALQEDGIQFFAFIAALRILNIVFAALNRPSFIFLAVFFIWAMTTTILGRLLIHLRRTECRPPPILDPHSEQYDPSLAVDVEADAYIAEWDRRRNRAISPFGLVPLNKRISNGSAHSARSDAESAWGNSPDNYDDVLHIAPAPLVYHYKKRAHDPNVRPWD